MSTLTPTEQYVAHLDAIYEASIELGGNDIVRQRRNEALRIARELGFPTPKNEEFKYTPLRPIADVTWLPADKPALPDTVLEPLTFKNQVRLVTINGRFDPNLSEIGQTPGLKVRGLGEALLNSPAEILGYLGKGIDLREFPLAALGTALLEDGLWLHFSRGAMVEPLIEIIHLVTGDGTVTAPRTLITTEEGATGKIVETYAGVDQRKTLNLPITEVHLARHTNIEHVKLQREADTAFHIHLWQAFQVGESEYRAYNIALGGDIARTDQNIYLDGEHITTRMDGVVVGTGEQLIDNHTRLDHAKPNCNSFEIYKQVLSGKATGVFNGKIFVHQDAQKTDAKQTNQALLLSPGAVINSKPQLEIFADDVKCTHGATVGSLEEGPLFYMRSRGIPKDHAESLLVYAFAAEVLELITDEDVKREIEKLVFDKLMA